MSRASQYQREEKCSNLKRDAEQIPSMLLPRFSEDMESTSHVYSSMQQQSSSSSHLFEDGPAKKRTEQSNITPQVANETRNRTASPWSDSNHSSMQAVASSGHHHHTSGNSAAYFHWPPSSRVNGTAEERAAYFSGSQKHTHVQLEVPLHETDERIMPIGQQASTLLDLMTIRAFHSKLLRRFSLGTAIGFRNRRGVLTDIPAIIVFVAHKVHKEWLHEYQLLPTVLEGPGGIWCDVDVVEFSYYGTPALAPKEQVYTELVEGLRGSDCCIGPGSQVASQETYGSLGAIVQSKSGARQVGFLTNRHVAVDLDYPNQKMFHPLPPNLGPSVYLGAVERATSFITDDLWYGIFASMNPETFVRADGAFIPFGDCFDVSRVTTTVKGLGDMGEVKIIDLQAPVGSIVGKQVLKVGRSSGLTKGSIMAYALEYNDEKGICFFTDFLIVGENRQAFDLEGDSGSLILVAEEEEGAKPRPIGIIWGGTANRGRLKLRNGYGPENWTSGVDLGRLLELLQLSLITSNEDLAAAVQEQRHWATGLVACSSQDLPYQDGEQVRKETIQHSGTMLMPLPESLPKMNSDMATSRFVDQDNVPNRNACKVEIGLLGFNFSPLRKEHSTSNGNYGFNVEDGTTEPAASKPGTLEELSLGFQLFNRNAKKQKTSDC